MSKITKAQFRRIKFQIEHYDSALEVAENCRKRTITDSRFHDMPNHRIRKSWHGVDSYDEAIQLLRDGYQPTVEQLRSSFNAGVSGAKTRFSFENSIQGFAPVVPLALKGVPNCMINMQMKPIKTKVIDVYYDMTASCDIDSDDIIKAGQKLLATVIALERQGYRFNLFVTQSYTGDDSCDMLAIRVKRDNQPIDLKRISFPLTHTGFFRVIGFDWYSKVPGGKYRYSYGHALNYELSTSQMNEMAKQVFGKNAIYISAASIIEKDEKHIEEVLTNGNSKD